jgi:hypothetical protein
MHIQQEANTCSLIIMSADLHHTSSFEPPSSGRVSAPLIKPMPMIARFHLVTRSGARLREVSTLAISQPRVCGVNEAAWSLSVVDKVKWCRLLSAYLLLRIASASSRSPHSFSPIARRSIRSKPCSYIVKRRLPVKYNHDPPTPCLSSSSSLPAHLIDALPSLATDDFLPQGDLAIRTSDGQDVPSETPRDPPYGIGEERVWVVRPVREELGRRPGRGGRRTEVDLDGSVLRRANAGEPSISNRLR